MTTTRPNWKTRLGRYRQMKVKRVDLVPAGANPLAHVTLAKSADIHDQIVITPSPLPIIKEPAMPNALADLTDEDIAGIDAYVQYLTAERDALAAAPETIEDPAEALLKSAPPELVERIVKAEAAAAEATAKAVEIQKAERTRVFKSQAAALVNLSGGDDGATSLGSILDAAESSLTGEQFAELTRVLTAADTQLTKAADLFGVKGQDDGPAASIKERAAVLVADGMSEVDALKTARREIPEN